MCKWAETVDKLRLHGLLSKARGGGVVTVDYVRWTQLSASAYSMSILVGHSVSSHDRKM